MVGSVILILRMRKLAQKWSNLTKDVQLVAKLRLK